MDTQPTKEEWDATVAFYKKAILHVAQHSYMEIPNTEEIIDVWSLSAFIKVWDALNDERKQFVAWMCGGNPFGLCSWALQFVEYAPRGTK